VRGQASFDWRLPGLTAGVDEAGVGRWQVSGRAAVILDDRCSIAGIADSRR
jgi:hypothetical protein